MGMRFNCTKGCGEAIEVTDEMLEEAKTTGRPIDVQHKVCPGSEGAPVRKFKVQTQVFELHPADDPDAEDGQELLASVGHTVEAGSFKQALPIIGQEMDNQWGRVASMADVVDNTPADQDG